MDEDKYPINENMPSACVCEMCQREVYKLTKHHLIPQTRHRNKKNKKNFDRKEVKERVLWICRTCHNALHAFFTNKELEYDYNTLEKIVIHEEVQKFLAWIKKQPVKSSKSLKVKKLKR